MSKHTISYEDLLKEHGDKDSIPYKDLLSTAEWKSKRNEILKRDLHVCTKCKKKATKHFNVDQLKSILGTNNLKQTWIVIGRDGKRTEDLKSGDYWFGPESTMNKHQAYDGLKYITTPSGWILIKSYKEYRLHVHPKVYVLNTLPWEVPNEDYETYCTWCHTELFKTDEIQSFLLVDGELVPTKMTPCKKCQGNDELPQNEQIEKGICPHCLGKRFEELIEN